MSESEEARSPNRIYTKNMDRLYSNFLNKNEQSHSTPPISSETTAIRSRYPAVSTSSTVLQGVGGFINDFRALTMEIERLRTSEKAYKEVLRLKQLELNKVSEEWCTAQAAQARNEMIIQAQTTEINSLKQQAKSIQDQNNYWDYKLEQASKGLEAMFQSSSKLTSKDDSIFCNGSESTNEVNPTENVNLQMQIYVNPASKSLMGESDTGKLTPCSNSQNQNTKCLQISSKLKRSLLHKKLVAAYRKLKILKDKLTKRMVEKVQTNQEIKIELAQKNKILQNLVRIVCKNKYKFRRLPTCRKRGDRSIAANSTPSASSKHSRDKSVPLQDGFACICGKRFKFISALHRHLGSKDKKFTCDFCNKTFLFFSDFSRHLRARHQRIFPPKTHGCRTCGAVFPSKIEFMKGWKHRNGECIRKGNSQVGTKV